ncbi:MAG: BACON domain-containing protein [Alistipes finegoldii]
MKKYLLWICTAALLLPGLPADDPEVDSVGRVGIQQQSLTASGDGEVLTLNVTSNAYWHLEFVDAATGESIRWVLPNESTGMGNADVKLTVARNRSTNGRSAYVNVTTDSESSTASILLSQGAGTVGGGDGMISIAQRFSIDSNLAMPLSGCALLRRRHDPARRGSP